MRSNRLRVQGSKVVFTANLSLGIKGMGGFSEVTGGSLGTEEKPPIPDSLLPNMISFFVHLG